MSAYASLAVQRSSAEQYDQPARRPQVIRETFQAFQIVSGPMTGDGVAVPFDTEETLDAAVQAASVRVAHKGKFFVRQTNELTGDVMLKFYAVKRKSTPAYRYHDHQTRAIRDTYAEHLFDLRGDAVERGAA